MRFFFFLALTALLIGPLCFTIARTVAKLRGLRLESGQRGEEFVAWCTIFAVPLISLVVAVIGQMNGFGFGFLALLSAVILVPLGFVVGFVCVNLVPKFHGTLVRISDRLYEWLQSKLRTDVNAHR